MNKNPENKWLILFDLDGTLLSKGEKEIPKGILKKIECLRKNGHDISINSGRGLVGIKKAFGNKNQTIISLPVITELGSKIHDYQTEEVLAETPLDHDALSKVLNQILENDKEANFSYWNKHRQRKVYSGDNEFIQNHSDSYGELTITESLDVFKKWVREDRPSMLRIDLRQPHNSEEYIGQHFEYHPFRNKPGFEITQKGIDKTSGIQELLKLCQLDPHKIILVGNCPRDQIRMENVESILVSGDKSISATIDQIIEESSNS